MADVQSAEAAAAPAFPPKTVIYCAICTLPPEYCEFGGTAQQCEDWLRESHPDLHSKIYSADALAGTVQTLSLEAQARATKDAAKKTAKATAAAKTASERKAAAKVIIKRIERNKRKYVTGIQGLDAHGFELKKVAKDFGKKFASGASVSKVPGGGEEILVQGDVAYEIEEELIGWGSIPDGNVEVIEEKKKKAAAPAV